VKDKNRDQSSALFLYELVVHIGFKNQPPEWHPQKALAIGNADKAA
jgi:hypothetical protein